MPVRGRERAIHREPLVSSLWHHSPRATGGCSPHLSLGDSPPAKGDSASDATAGCYESRRNATPTTPLQRPAPAHAGNPELVAASGGPCPAFHCAVQPPSTTTLDPVA